MDTKNNIRWVDNMELTNEIAKVCQAFDLHGELVRTGVFTDGLINASYLAVFDDGGKTNKFLVQSINTNVFKNVDGLMGNIVGVTSFLREKIIQQGGDPERETLNFVPAKDGKFYAQVNGKHWRIYKYVDNSYTMNVIEDSKCFENAGRGFGMFQRNLNDYPSEELHETIKDFHNTPKRMENLEKSIAADVKGRASSVLDEINFALERKEDAKLLISLHEKGLIPLRVTHNDTKLNNILFDKTTGENICVIDLDTIMPGFSLYDFGDAIRFGANTTKEDDPDLNNVDISIKLFECFTRGFLGACAKALTRTEVECLAFSAKLMTFECGIRFLTDYLDGDVYFRTDYKEHNLVRARNQFKLVEAIEANLDRMNEIVERIYNEALKA